jgi:hypothetical protein
MTVIAQIALDMPVQPTSADLLKALTAAEQAGFERAYQEMATALAPLDLGPLEPEVEMQCDGTDSGMPCVLRANHAGFCKSHRYLELHPEHRSERFGEGTGEPS